MARQKRSTLKRGADALDQHKKVQEQEDARREANSSGGVYRFWVRGKERGKGYEEHEVVILDDDVMAECPMAMEHDIPGPGMSFKETRHHVCVDEIENCVLCRANEQGIAEEMKRAGYNQYMSLLDLTPFEIKRGNRAGTLVEASRKLHVIPHRAFEKFHKVFQHAKREHGTTRGVYMVLTKHEKMDARCGEPIMLDNGMMYEMWDEEDLLEYANEEVVRDGKVVKEEGQDIEPFDYDELLAPPEQKLLRTLYNLPKTVGGSDEEEEDVGESRSSRRSRRSRGGKSEDDAPAPKGRSSRSRRRSARDDQDDQDDQYDQDDQSDQDDAGYDDQDDQDDEPPRTRRRARKKEQAEEEQPKRRARRRAPVDEDQEDEPAPKKRTRRSAPKEDQPRSTRSSRKRRDDRDLDDEIPF